MTRKKLILMLIAAGLVAATSTAFSLYPWNWLVNDSPAGAETLPMRVPAPTFAAAPPVRPASR